jgi:hypothetical protein
MSEHNAIKFNATAIPIDEYIDKRIDERLDRRIDERIENYFSNNKKEKQEIDNCPCCGGEAKIQGPFVGLGPSYIYIKCKDCGLRTRNVQASTDYCAEDEAIKLWNRRGE